MVKEAHDRKGWWDTGIIRVRPDELLIRGYAIEDLMGRVTFGEMAYLMIMGELPSSSGSGVIRNSVPRDAGHLRTSTPISAWVRTAG